MTMLKAKTFESKEAARHWSAERDGSSLTHFYPTMLPSRNRRNSMKMNDRGLGYPTMKPGGMTALSSTLG